MERCLNCMSKVEGTKNKKCPFCNEKIRGKNRNGFIEPGQIIKNIYLLGNVKKKKRKENIYIGWSMALKCKVFIKELCLPEESEKSEVFQIVYEKEKKKYMEEARSILDLQEIRGQVSIYDIFEEKGKAFIVEEYKEDREISHKNNKKINKKSKENKNPKRKNIYRLLFLGTLVSAVSISLYFLREVDLIDNDLEKNGETVSTVAVAENKKIVSKEAIEENEKVVSEEAIVENKEAVSKVAVEETNETKEFIKELFTYDKPQKNRKPQKINKNNKTKKHKESLKSKIRGKSKESRESKKNKKSNKSKKSNKRKIYKEYQGSKRIKKTYKTRKNEETNKITNKRTNKSKKTKETNKINKSKIDRSGKIKKSSDQKKSGEKIESREIDYREIISNE